MISIDINKVREDGRRLHEISQDADRIARNLSAASKSQADSWQGGAGSEFQSYTDSLITEMIAFGAETERLANDIIRAASVFEAADSTL